MFPFPFFKKYVWVLDRCWFEDPARKMLKNKLEFEKITKSFSKIFSDENHNL